MQKTIITSIIVSVLVLAPVRIDLTPSLSHGASLPSSGASVSGVLPNAQIEALYRETLLSLLKVLLQQLASLQAQLAALEARSALTVGAPTETPAPTPAPIPAPAPSYDGVDAPVIEILLSGDVIPNQGTIVISSSSVEKAVDWLATQSDRHPVSCEGEGTVIAGHLGAQGRTMIAFRNPGTYSFLLTCRDTITLKSKSSTATIMVQ